MSNNEFHQRRLSATPRGVGVMCNFFAQSAENATLKDVEGNEYMGEPQNSEKIVR